MPTGKAEFRHTIQGRKIVLRVEADDGSSLWRDEGLIEGHRLIFEDAVWEKEQ